MLLYVLLIFLVCLNFNCDAHSQERSVRRSVISLMYLNNTVSYARGISNRTGLCRWLRGFRHQSKMCRSKKGFPEVLLNAKELALIHCKNQFRYDRWNCSYKKSFFKKLYRETAFMQSLATSAIMYSVARACSEGKLQDCKCPTYENRRFSNANWTWGGCGDNVQDAKKITRKVLQLRQNGDVQKQILNHDSEVGIGTVIENEMKVCTCHGVSASCVMKTCWKRVKPFIKIAQDLKDHYHNAIRVTPSINKANFKTVLKRRQLKALYYLMTSPNLCPTTTGRRCKNISNCETLCCGRGFDESLVSVSRKCQCRWQNTTYPTVQCDLCDEAETIYTCK